MIASADGSATVLDTGSGVVRLATSLDPESYPRGLALCADGSVLVGTWRQDSLGVWIRDGATGRLRARLDTLDDLAAVSPDGSHVVTKRRYLALDCAHIWNLAAAPQPRRGLHRDRHVLRSCVRLKGHEEPVTAAAFHPGGTLVATGSRDCTVRIWQVADGAEVATLTGHHEPITGVAFSPDGLLLATTSSDNLIRLWDVSGAPALAATLAPLGNGAHVTLLPDGSYKLRGEPDESLWWAMRLCRLAPGELDEYVPEIRRLPADAPIRPPRN
jgi:WD40 repeat protein